MEILEQDSSVSNSEINEINPNMSHAQKLKNMHKAVNQILKKTQKTKEHLKNLRQEVEVTCEELKQDPDEGKNDCEELDLSEISGHETENVWDEIKSLEIQIKMLKDKVKNDEEVIKNRKKQSEEIKELIQEIESFQSSRFEKKMCECKSCFVF